MTTLIVILIIAFIIGLLTRKKGDNFLDTLGSGCNTIILIIIVLVVLAFLMLNK
jgi:hypothetical protein